MSQKNLGIVIADISGTTRLYRKIGTGEAQHALERCVRRMERAVESHRGRIVAPAVDEMIAVFPGADDAASGAIEMQERIADLPPVSGVKLSIRIGMHFGPAEESPSGVRGPAVDAGRALLTLAGPHQVLTCAQTAEALSHELRPQLRSLEQLMIETADGECQVYELSWHGDPEVTMRSPADTVVGLPPAAELPPPVAVAAEPGAGTNASVPVERYCLRLNGRAYLIDERTPSITIGRDKTCDVVVRDRKASRVHVRLEKRGSDRFFLVDLSTNGTFVAVDGAKELKVHNDETRLSGKGRLAFGHSTGSDDAEVGEFESL